MTGVGTLLSGIALVWVLGPDTIATTVYLGLGLVVLATESLLWAATLVMMLV